MIYSRLPDRLLWQGTGYVHTPRFWSEGSENIATVG